MADEQGTDPSVASVRHLVPALTRMAPELVDLDLPEETRADCANCPMAGQPFHASVRCCTYEPALPNFLVGRALLRDDAGAAKVRARIRTGVGLTALGIRPDPAWVEQYAANRATDFGRNADWVCPYWVEGPLSCSIWQDRNAVCRTWHCKHTEGVRGHRLWSAVRKLAQGAEQRLSAWCAEHETSPSDADPDAWEAYFVATARRAASIDGDALESLEDDAFGELRQTVRDAHTRLRRELPAVMGVEVRAMVDHGDVIELAGYTPWDTVRLPKTVFVLLAEFDGERSRVDAVERAVAAEPSVDPAWVRMLWNIGVLRGRDDGDDAPWGFGGPDLTPEGLAERFGR